LAHAAPPKVNFLYPAGAQRGSTAAITASGEFSNWPVQLWADRPGLTATCDKEKGKLQIAVAEDAAPGTYWLRLFDGEGASQPKPFIVDSLAEVLEAETNDTPAKPQIVEPRVIVNGKLGKSGDVDGYRVQLQAGQTLVAALQANSVLGSPMDAVLQICELIERPSSLASASGSSSSVANSETKPRPEAYVVEQIHDALGLDPRLAFTAQRDGAYLVRLFAFPATPDSSIRFAGADTFIYRLTLTTGGFVDHALPLAVGNEETQVRLCGWNLIAGATAIAGPLSAELDPLTPADASLTWVWRGDMAGAAALTRLDHVSVAAAEDAGQPQEVALPVTVSGQLETPGDVDAFVFSAAKDQKLRLRVASKALGFQTDPMIEVQDEAGKKLAEADDTGREDRDPQLDFTAPAEGRFRAVVRDLSGRGGMRMAYRLTIEPIRPDFSLALAADSFVIQKDKPLEIPINITVRDGLREPIEIHAVGLPPGVTADQVKFTPTEDAPRPSGEGGRRRRSQSSEGPRGPTVNLIVKADAAAAIAAGTPIRIEGRTAGTTPLIRTARFPLNLPLAGSHHAVWLTVKK
jgi:hypothetical protein